jgi:hypothetical protein
VALVNGGKKWLWKITSETLWQTMLESFGKQHWKIALENGIGKQCWKTALENSIGKWCWKTTLEN